MLGTLCYVDVLGNEPSSCDNRNPCVEPTGRGQLHERVADGESRWTMGVGKGQVGSSNMPCGNRSETLLFKVLTQHFKTRTVIP